jgi:hypothetical protein
MNIKISYNSNIYVLLRHSFFIVKNVEVTYKATKIVSAFQKSFVNFASLVLHDDTDRMGGILTNIKEY